MLGDLFREVMPQAARGKAGEPTLRKILLREICTAAENLGRIAIALEKIAGIEPPSAPSESLPDGAKPVKNEAMFAEGVRVARLAPDDNDGPYIVQKIGGRKYYVPVPKEDSNADR